MVTSETMKKIDIKQEIQLHPIISMPELAYPTKGNIRNVRLFSKKTYLRDEQYAIGIEFILQS